MDKIIKCDVLVVGAGQAGLFAAIKAKEQGAEVVLTDKGLAGRAGQSQNISSMCVFDPDEDDIEQWMNSSATHNDYIADPKWIRLVYEESKARWEDLGTYGFENIKFDHDGNAFVSPITDDGWEYAPGGIMTGTKPGETGQFCLKWRFIEHRQHEKMRNYAVSIGVKVMDFFTVTDLIKQDGRIVGAVGFAVDCEDTYIFQTKSVVLAAGNGGMKTPGVCTVTTTGDAQAMAYRIGCGVTGKEWTDDHPARADFPAFSWTNERERDFMTSKSESANFHGFRLVNAKGEELGNVRESMRGKASSDFFDGSIMAYEADKGRAPLFFYVMDDPNSYPMNHSPKDYPREPMDDKAGEAGYVRMGMSRAMGQSFHLSDGVWCDDLSCVTEVPGLYAAGDCLGARPGYTGPGFACSFTAVTGTRAGTNAAIYAKSVPDTEIDSEKLAEVTKTLWAPMKRVGGFSARWVNQVISNTLTPYWVLLMKEEKRLQNALDQIVYIRDHLVPNIWAQDTHELRQAHEMRSIILHCEMKLRASLMRKESRWNHYREDYPLRDDENWLCWIKIQEVNGEMQLIKVPVPEEMRPDPSLSYAERYPNTFPGEPDLDYLK